MPDLVIGCPVAGRAWILPAWFAAVETACDVAGLAPEFVFVVPANDESSAVIRDITKVMRRPPSDVIFTDEPAREDRRVWSGDRYHHMVELRNMLLHRVRQIGPSVFWSLDSDILPSSECLKISLELLGDYDAVGQRTFMTPPPDLCYSSHAQLVNGSLVNRADSPGAVLPVDCIMASKLLSPRAYAVDYRWHQMGEDIGISEAWAELGITRGWDGRVGLKHVMGPEWLDHIDARVGF